MRYAKFGSTGLFVSELCLGTMTFGGEGAVWEHIGKLQQTEADTLIGRAIDGGINFIDTANVYSGGLSETITGTALKNLKVPRENVVVATKVFGETGTKAVNSRGLSRFHIMESVKASLRRLQLDYVDLYQVHGFDPATPIEETLRALDALVQQGHVRYIGVSNWAAWQIMKALGVSERLGLARFESLQAYYTIAGRDLEREIVPLLQSEGVGLMVWSPLAGGLLSGKYGRNVKAEEGSRRTTFDFPPVDLERGYDCIDAMRGIAEAKGVSVAQIALAWLLHQKVVTTVIVGAKRVEQLEDNLAATSVSLTADELAALDKVSALPPEYPGWMLARQGEARRTQLLQSANR
ncbi:aryl-alcohol dehydrogenase-like predicted oxidoreductase [Trinickia symbiotica]|uniref:Aldo/keto reductase n=1 Tax=Trinickia symbiotica TaxID=863227 RepID=A0A2N7X2C8_9BURK|nr:aldo/keto reductase [Trinickia symbiotica]PMS35896.1 aldo/keto reductase [Trinickia symbiotica]PPK44453.1 aryl-alcohol dehydrogenase-like predicted oxidoreductase [Trinickia symbiotica]